MPLLNLFPVLPLYYNVMHCYFSEENQILPLLLLLVTVQVPQTFCHQVSDNPLSIKKPSLFFLYRFTVKILSPHYLVL